MATRKYTLNADGLVKIIISLASLLLVGLNLLRIFNVPMTFDECVPYSELTMSFWDIARLKIVSSNNHLLNSMIRKVFVQVFSNTPFWLRFDNLLAQIGFLIFTSLLSRCLFKNRFWQVCVFLTLNLHLFMFEFWGLSRGYGLAACFVTGSVYYLLRYADNKKVATLSTCLFMSILAVYANFALLDYYCGLVCSLLFYLFILSLQKQPQAVRGIYKGLLTATLSSFALFLLIAVPVGKLIKEHEFYYGGTHNVVSDTFTSLLRENFWWSLDEKKVLLNNVAVCILPLAGLIGIYYIVMMIRSGFTRPLVTGAMLWILFAAPVAGMVLQHQFMYVLYPLDRTALYLIPLFILCFTYWFSMAGQRVLLPASIILCSFTGFLLYTFLLNMNISTTRLWWAGKNDLVVLKRIMNETKNKPGKNKIAVSWVFINPFSYYVESTYGQYFLPVEDARNIKDSAINADKFDYYYLAKEAHGKLPECYHVDTSFYDSTFILWKKN